MLLSAAVYADYSITSFSVVNTGSQLSCTWDVSDSLAVQSFTLYRDQAVIASDLATNIRQYTDGAIDFNNQYTYVLKAVFPASTIVFRTNIVTVGANPNINNRSINGSVFNTGQKPVVNIPILLTDTNGNSWTTVTGPNGLFYFSNLILGTYTAAAAHESQMKHAPALYTVVFSNLMNSPLTADYLDFTNTLILKTNFFINSHTVKSSDHEWVVTLYNNTGRFRQAKVTLMNINGMLLSLVQDGIIPSGLFDMTFQYSKTGQIRNGVHFIAVEWDEDNGTTTRDVFTVILY